MYFHLDPTLTARGFDISSPKKDSYATIPFCVPGERILRGYYRVVSNLLDMLNSKFCFRVFEGILTGRLKQLHLLIPQPQKRSPMRDISTTE